MSLASPETSAALSLLSARAVRERAHRMLAIGLDEGLPNFRIDLDRMDDAIDLVLKTTRKAYPSLDIPFHSRWRHFVMNGDNRWADIAGRTKWPDRAARARAEFDLAIVSVLLDAGAGPIVALPRSPNRIGDRPFGRIGAGEPCDVRRRRILGRSASSPCGSTPACLRILALPTSNAACRSRTAIRWSGSTVARICCAASAGWWLRNRKYSAASTRRGPAACSIDLQCRPTADGLPAPTILSELLQQLGPVWPSRLTLGGIALGDCWKHPALTSADATNGLVPLHKLSQWLAYSLIEPLQTAGIEVTDIDGLTGLAEYRNGGLFVDTGVLAFRDAGSCAAGA